MKDEALKLALEALEYIHAETSTEEDRLIDKAITAIKQALALDKKAENARELGLDYEPHKGLSEHLAQATNGRVRIDPVTGDVGIGTAHAQSAPVQDSTCSEALRAQGKAYPRTCKKCGKGPCIGAPKQPPAQPAPVQPMAHIVGEIDHTGKVWAPAQPAVPDAMTSADIQEHIEYVAGWNDCRQAMLEMMKARTV